MRVLPTNFQAIPIWMRTDARYVLEHSNQLVATSDTVVATQA